METRKDTLSSSKLCRFCLTQSDTLTSIYEKRASKNTVSLPLKILSCVSIEVFPSDKMPTYICNRCKFFMEISYEFKHLCRQSDENIMQYIQKGTPLSSVTWSQSLLKLFRVANKAPEVPLMKTIIEGGTTVQVTAQESDTDEEDEENVYNVKIGDGSDDGSKSARVKVITATGKPDKGKAKRGKGFTSPAKLSRHARTHAEDRSYPCKYCNKSFVKTQHLTRHLRLKHRETIRTCRGPFGESDQYRCEQCEDSFATQDELIYHSAIHATQNLICPLCQEKFDDVDAVTAHIKSHVNGTEFMCELCELVFTSKEKLDIHITNAHDDEIRSVPDLLQDESSMEMDADEEEEDAGIHLKELDDHMVVEIKKANEFLLSSTQDESEEKLENTNSEDSDIEMTLPDLMAADAIANKDSGKVTPEKSPTASILRKAEEVKKKLKQQPTQELGAEKRNKNEKTNSGGANDKSLRLLEKELQELKRTNTRSEAAKTPVKPLESLRSRRGQIHTSTPKLRTPAEEKKTQVAVKSPAIEKKLPERRVVTKENKEPKESKDTKVNNVSAKEDKEKEVKEAKEKEAKEKEKETAKSIVKNGNERSVPEEGIRRSTRPSKIKDYAKMIRDRSQDSDDNYDTDDTDDEEYTEPDRSIENKPKRRASLKTPASKQTPTTTTPAPRKRGRPRKDAAVAPKIRKEEIEDAEDSSESEKDKSKNATIAEKDQDNTDKDHKDTAETSVPEQKSAVIVSPTGQTLKKIPIKCLPPGVKPMPLPVNARNMGGPEVCEMQIGKKVVKVQKIVMTKADVEAMAKKGLVEVKDGTIVLKQGIKLPTMDSTLKTSLVGEDASKESPSKREKPAPSRCDFSDED